MNQDTKDSILAKAQELSVAKLVNGVQDASRRLGKQTKSQVSVGLGVGAANRERFVKRLKQEGLGHVEVTADGCPVFTSDRERRKIAQMQGQVNKESYYD